MRKTKWRRVSPQGQRILDLEIELRAHGTRNASARARLFRILSYLNVRIADGHLLRKINEARSVVRDL